MRRRIQVPHVVWGVVGALVASGLLFAPGAADADTAPPVTNPPTPRTVGTNPLPTVQIGQGVVWSQVIVGDKVYAVGEFSTARPAGAAPGTQQVTRNNLLAFDIDTGVLEAAWAPSTNGAVYDITASPDGTRLYIAGNFTVVNGQTRNRVAALNPISASTPQSSWGALVTGFNPNVSGSTYGIAATSTAVYYGGSFGSSGGQARTRLAATRVSDGALLPWAPRAEGGLVRDIAVSPDGTQVLIAGSFTTLNGSSNPGFGLGSVDAVSATLRPWAANTSLVRNGGPNGDVLSLTSDGAGSVYATGGTYARSGGTLEGVARMSWNGGAVQWIEDCHGDSYDALPLNGAVYVVTHAHYCGNVPGGFPQSEPWTRYKGIAFSEQATGTLRPDYLGYSNFNGTPAPSLLHWYPDMPFGNYTASGQAGWSLVGNNDYVVAGGEFPRVGGVAQQGLVRFARYDLPGTPNNSGPRVTGSLTNPTVTSPGAGQALVCWQTNYDWDNQMMTYRVIRNNVVSSPIATKTVGSADWKRPYACHLDNGQTPGASVTYRIIASDPFGNTTQSNLVPVTISGSGSAGPYAAAVAADGPMHYWRLDEPSGTTAADSTGLNNLTVSSGVTKGVAGAVSGHTAYTFNGSSSQIAYNSVAKPGPFYYSVEAWFRTSTSSGGKILGFGNSQTGLSSTHDRMLYVDNSGRVNFGSRQGGSLRVATSGSGLNNNQWHHAVGTVEDSGMSLYVDGVRVGFRSDTRTGHSYNGFWRVGGDNISSGWVNNPANDFFNGSIDEVAVYTHALTASQVSQHYAARSGTPSNQPPTAGFTFTVSDLTATFNSSGSVDPDGTITSRSWNFGDGASSPLANPSHAYAAGGTYNVTLTVTDDDGASSQVSRLVTVDDPGGPTPLVSDTFTRTLTGGWGTADSGDPWTVQSPTTRYSVASGRGRMTIDVAGAGPWAFLNGISAANLNGSVDVSTDKAATGGGIYHTVALRRSGTSEYRVKIWLPSNGTVVLVMSRLVSGTQTTLGTFTIPGLNYIPGDQIRLEFSISGSGTTTLTAKAWLVGNAEPGVQLTRTDSTAGSLQGPGGVGIQGYMAGSATNAPVIASYDNFELFGG